MMKLLTVFICLGLLMSACKKNNVRPYQTQGVLLGYDQRKCASPYCGGLMVTIQNDTAKNPPAFYQVNATLSKLGLSEGMKLPANISFNCKSDTGVVNTLHYIVITQIKVIK